MTTAGFALTIPNHAPGERDIVMDAHLVDSPATYPSAGIDHDMSEHFSSVIAGVLTLEQAAGAAVAALTPQVEPDQPSQGHLRIRLFRIVGSNLVPLPAGTSLQGLRWRCLAIGYPKVTP